MKNTKKCIKLLSKRFVFSSIDSCINFMNSKHEIIFSLLSLWILNLYISEWIFFSFQLNFMNSKPLNIRMNSFFLLS